MHLEPLHLFAVRVHDQHALEADVGDLVRAQAFGQPLTLTVIGTSRSGVFPSPTSALARSLGRRSRGQELDAGAGHRVAPPVGQARGQADLLEVGGERRDVPATPMTTSLYTEACPKRRTAHEASQARPVSVVPSIRPTTAAASDVEVAVLLLVDADVVAPARGSAGLATSVRWRYSVSRTSRNFSTPQSATRNFSRARDRGRR